MKVRLDAKLCVGHGRCYELAPDVFDEDLRGHCRLMHRDVIPPTLDEGARLAVANCPESALSIDED